MNAIRRFATLLLIGGSTAALAQGASPCTYLPEALVRTVFRIPAAQTLEKKDGATCRWELPAASRSRGVSLNFMRSSPVRPGTIDTLFARMRDGMSSEVRGKQVTIAPKDVKWVSGVGDKAFWNNDLSQLAVTAKGRLFYVTVNLDGWSSEDKLAGSVEVAKAVAGAL